MKVTLLGFTLPAADMDAIAESDVNMPTQTAAFSGALVAALGAAGVRVTLLSSAPVTSYPHNPQVVFHGGPFVHDGVRGEKLGFVNLVVLKHISRFVTCLTRGTRALRRWRPDVLLIHGVHSPFVSYGLIARRLFHTRMVVVLTDPPGGVAPTDGRLVAILKRLDTRLVRWALRSSDGVIALTAPLANDFAPGTQSMVMEGILADVVRPRVRDSAMPDESFRVLYAGGLLASYGVDNLVRAVVSIEADELHLDIYGKGPLASWIAAQSEIDRRISTPLFAPREEVLERYLSADLLVQPRPADQDFVRYSFPSKLLEYMASGTPVLTTRLSGIPADYQPYLYWIDDDTSEGVARALAEVMTVPADARFAQGRRAAEFIRTRCSSVAQGDRIRVFLDDMVRG